MKVLAKVYSIDLAIPKSPSFTLSSCKNTFSAFISRCKIFYECTHYNAKQSEVNQSII